MSLQQRPLSPPPPPPPATVYRHPISTTARGDRSPLIGVLTVIIVLGVIACLIGRLCSGRRIAGIGQYGVEDGWRGTVPPASTGCRQLSSTIQFRHGGRRRRRSWFAAHLRRQP
ncbi:hypothetical protein HPP92_025037 [Vanilla planifolia]|uniref:Uncharacterized protein n=1 Tax=Vanilla planifolia TaxID=51239 RepID=A0A835PJB7_VANPL|nr:hypothetical protein HPP92_025037 [Vanilla planifolia]